MAINITTVLTTTTTSTDFTTSTTTDITTSGIKSSKICFLVFLLHVSDFSNNTTSL